MRYVTILLAALLALGPVSSHAQVAAKAGDFIRISRDSAGEDTLSGYLIRHDRDSILVRIPGGVEHRLARAEVKAVQRRRLSASGRAVAMGMRGGIIGWGVGAVIYLGRGGSEGPMSGGALAHTISGAILGSFIGGLIGNQVTDEIWDVATADALTWRHQWRVGDVVLWDNRCVMHRRDAFDPDSRRVMHRTQIKGETRQAES